MTTLEIVKHDTDFAKLQSQWQIFWAELHGGIFQSYEWIAAWAAHRPKRCRLLIIVIRRDGQLTGILPLAVRHYLQVRILEWAGQAISDHCDGLGSPEALRSGWVHVVAQGGFDIIRLKNIHPQAAIRPILAADQTLSLIEDKQDLCLRINSVWRDGESWYRSLVTRRRNNYLRRRRLLGDIGQIEVRHLEAMPTKALLFEVYNAKQRALSATGTPSPLLEGGAARFVDVVEALEKLNRLRMSVMTCSGKMVAASINAGQGSDLFLYLPAYDREYAHTSPGSVLLIECVRWAFDQGYTTIDFLRGIEDYKLQYANDKLQLGAFVGAFTLLGKISLRVFQVREAAQDTPITEQASLGIGSAYSQRKVSTSRNQQPSS